MSRTVKCPRTSSKCLIFDRPVSYLILLGCFLFAAGCSSSSAPPQGSADPSSDASSSAPKGPNFASALRKAASGQRAEPDEGASREGEFVNEDAEEEVVAPEPPPGDTEMVEEVAAVGAGTKSNIVKGGGIISEPVRAFFRTGERIVFDITIPNAMKTFKAGNDNKGPKDHEEFMARIIQENSIELPSLPDGHKYRYDPETEDLLVQRPKN
jgi:hypothetical protein